MTQITQQEEMLQEKNNILVKIVDLHPSRVAAYNTKGVLVYANRYYIDTNELKPSDINHLHFSQISRCNIGFENILEKLRTTSSFVLQKKQYNLWYESIFYSIEDEFIIHIYSDITAQKEKEIELEQLAVFFENSSEGIIIADAKNQICSVNEAFTKITGYSKEEILGKTPSLLKSGVHDSLFYEEIWNSLQEKSLWRGEIYNRRKDGSIYSEWISISKILNPKYNEEYYVAIFTDITELKEKNNKLYYYANYDILTGLANRAQFEAYLKNAIANAKRNETQLALFFVDLDKFKDVNDTFGHDVGDKMLQSVANRIQDALRGDDFVARIGGDEFVLVLKEIKSHKDIAFLAKKLSKVIQEPIKIEEKLFFMSLSIGVAIYPEHGAVASELIKNADTAMYAVKEHGRSGYLLYNKGMTHQVSQKLNTQNELQVAIEQEQFEMHYQAIVDLQTDKIVGAEALVRWNHPQKGLLAPASFLAYLDDSNMVVAFGTLVIKKVFSDFFTLQQALNNPDFIVSINISVKHFFDNNFVNHLLEMCKTFGIYPRQIELEILETTIMNNTTLAQKKFELLKQEGFHIAIDDFGTGYSSLSYLKNFKVDKLKIDQSFIRDFLEDNNDKAIVEAIIKLADTFGFDVQAEGIEVLEHQTLLKKLHCHLAQGYFYNKPLSRDAFLKLFKKA